MSARIDMVGHRFGRLVVSEMLPSSPGTKRSRVRAVCDCGAEKTYYGTDLRTGNTSSCGCFRVDAPGMRGHGLSKTPIYGVWVGMRDRCENPNDPAYANYGGRGITVCGRWADFLNFYEDMGPRPAGMSIERIDVNGNYEPSNCKWATRAEQARNRRSNIYATINGEKKCLLDWCQEMGFRYGQAVRLVRERGMSPEDALSSLKRA